MKLSFFLGLLVLPSLTMAQSSPVPALIPTPQTLIPGTGQFVITPQTRLNILTPVANVRQMVADYLPGIPFNDAPRQTKAITVRLAPVGGLGPEGYELKISPTGVSLTAPEPAGIFYGLQTLRQLLPPTQGVKNRTLAALTIRDQPRFGWRGLMLDVSRHFFAKADVKQFIDQMARYKFNIFHWHLTDDQGWRVEIKSLPKLTSVGAWRVPRMGDWNSIENTQPGELPTYGGFYTQDDIREIVAYANQRHITIVPEVDMPGHSLAAIAAYPELTCSQKPATVPPNGKFYKLEDNTLNPCNDSTYLFIDKVLTEIAGLFPGPYIHIGGDEAYKGFWEQCAACKPVMAANNLKNAEELQSYFVKRVEKIVQSKGKKLIGWDEILEGGLAPDATVMSWRGMKGGIEAARQGHPVIMTPAQHCYLDLYQGEPTAEPSTYSMSRLSDAYAFEPVPDGVDARLILGGQGNLWTESVPTARHAEYMVWPRSLALAEVLWSPKSSRNWPDFVQRTERHLIRFDALGISYARSYQNPIVTIKRHPMGPLEITLSHELANTDLFYTVDNTMPDQMTTRYTQPFVLPKGATRIKIMAYRANQPTGRLIDVPIEELAKRAR
ncbi:MAG: family 20 glycosylhydrolase [Bacteroidetes bacterium]|nr:family 20 glycosylhydrolase [Fibrella sp.]